MRQKQYNAQRKTTEKQTSTDKAILN